MSYFKIRIITFIHIIKTRMKQYSKHFKNLFGRIVVILKNGLEIEKKVCDFKVPLGCLGLNN